MAKQATLEKLRALWELTSLNTQELAAVITLLEREGLLTHREVLEEIQRQ